MMSGIVIDVPVLAYRTWVINCFLDGERDIQWENELAQSLKGVACDYDPDHLHVK